MIELTMLLLGMAALLALADWRRGLFLCVLTGLLQDPLRKLAPDQPTYFVVLVGVVFAMTFWSAFRSHVPLMPSAVDGWRESLGRPFLLYVFWVLAQAVHSLVMYRSPTLTGVGIMVWLAPAAAATLAYQFALHRGMPGLVGLLRFYCIGAMVSLLGVYLEYSGVDWAALREVGPGLSIYGIDGLLKAYSGFFRASEVAAWHAATIAAIVVMLFSIGRVNSSRLLMTAALVVGVVALGMLTGRRKMLVEVVIFLGVFLLLLAWFQRGSTKLAISAGLGLALLVWAVLGLQEPDAQGQRPATGTHAVGGDRYQGYADRGQTVFEDIPKRVADLGIGPIFWALDSVGFLGAGLGTGSQQGTGRSESVNIDGGAAEGGLGKIVIELGLPGLPLIAWLLVALARHVKQGLLFTARVAPTQARLAYGLVALLLAKLSSFSVATQVYSDLFVLLLMGWCVGFVLALPVLAARGQAPTQSLRPAPRFRRRPA